MGVGSRVAVGCEGNPGAFTSENLVELGNELGIPIVDGWLDRSLELIQLPGQVSGLLGNPGAVGMCRAIGVQNELVRKTAMLIGSATKSQDIRTPQSYP